jgi:hypothetical protein
MNDEPTTTTSTDASYDPETGEVLGAARHRRRRGRERTPEEQVVYEERRAQRGRMLAAVEALSPALAISGDPPVRDLGGALRDVSHAREVAPLLRLPRASGQGGPGSALVASARDYDGASGGESRGPTCSRAWSTTTARASSAARGALR